MCPKCEANEWVDMKVHFGRYTYPRCANCLRLARRKKAVTPEGRSLNRTRSRKYYVSARAKYLLGGAKRRAQKFGLAFDLAVHDIIVPDVCPLLGIPLEVGHRVQTDASPSLDRIDPTKGYIRGNVWVISYRANAIKQNATLDELRLLVANLEKRFSAPPEIQEAPRQKERALYGDAVCDRLTSEQIQEVTLLGGALSTRKLARRFGVTMATIYRVLHPHPVGV